ncbi:CoA transferase [Amycolatopsis regifaucium]|uniref:CoA transferase n=1 Tax=Amycolatopsis regifaucium TaxID=546365 RepID=A0A154M3P2_9PSEU|nr:CoA transferase [Amycolatopsis regifaucium]KZB79224.1 hypothetical protein AVL48_16625 [Amycolatopsis regifaucium]SFH12189.1 CoA-transferase family III [Amycolatopsis regifaucium]
MAGHLLRLLGATVLRIEPPGGDPLRWVPPIAGDTSARFRALNEGKEVVEADLTTPGGRRQLLELAAGADVFLHNWAPAKAGQWSLCPNDLARVRPGIVYVSASGWGTEFGPKPPVGTDYVVQAYAGVSPSLMTIVDVFGGIVSAHGIMTALARAATRADSSLLSAASRLNAGAGRRCDRPLTVPVCEDLAALAVGVHRMTWVSATGVVLPDLVPVELRRERVRMDTVRTGICTRCSVTGCASIRCAQRSSTTRDR